MGFTHGQGGPTQYTVKEGDNLYNIAQQFRTTIEQILKNNPQINDRNHIEVGWVLQIY